MKRWVLAFLLVPALASAQGIRDNTTYILKQIQASTSGLARVTYVDSTVQSATNSLATWVSATFYLASNPDSFVTASVTNGLASIEYVDNGTNALWTSIIAYGNTNWAGGSGGGDVYLASNNVFTATNYFEDIVVDALDADYSQIITLLNGTAGEYVKLQMYRGQGQFSSSGRNASWNFLNPMYVGNSPFYVYSGADYLGAEIASGIPTIFTLTEDTLRLNTLSSSSGNTRMTLTSSGITNHVDTTIEGDLAVTNITATGNITGANLYPLQHVFMRSDKNIYWGSFNNYFERWKSSSTAYEFWTTDADGGGTDGIVWSIQDGTNDIAFHGSVAVSNNLNVGGNILASGSLYLDNGQQIVIEDAGGTPRSVLLGQADDVTLQNNFGGDGGDVVVRTQAGGVETARFTSEGNVGIGTNNPSAPLDIATTNATGVSIETAGGIEMGDLGWLVFDGVGGDTRIRHNSGGLYFEVQGGAPMSLGSGIMQIGNDVRMAYGSSPSYWGRYDSGNTQYEFESTDVDGSGTDGTVWSVSNGTNDVVFAGHVSGADPTSGSNFVTKTYGDANYVIEGTIPTVTNVDYAINFNGYPKITLNTNMISYSGSGTAITIPSFANAFDNDFSTTTTTGTVSTAQQSYLIDLGTNYSGVVFATVVAKAPANQNGWINVGYAYDTVQQAGVAESGYGSSPVAPSQLNWYDNNQERTNDVVHYFSGNQIVVSARANGNMTFHFQEIIVYGVTNGFANFTDPRR